jgi:hypothetical protein
MGKNLCTERDSNQTFHCASNRRLFVHRCHWFHINSNNSIHLLECLPAAVAYNRQALKIIT